MMKRLDLRHIVCAVDLPGQLSSTLALTIAIARARKAELRALHVVTSEGASGPDAHVRRASIMRQLRESLAEADPNHDLVGAAVRAGRSRYAESCVSPAGCMLGCIVLGAPRSESTGASCGPGGIRGHPALGVSSGDCASPHHRCRGHRRNVPPNCVRR